jgi:hypothetical protein
MDMLDRELDIITMSVPPAIAAVLRDEQRRHLAGEVGESRLAVEERCRVARQFAFRHYLEDMHSFVSRRVSKSGA